MPSSRGSTSRSTPERPISIASPFRYRWAKGINIAALTVEGDDAWFTATRRERKSDGTIRWLVYYVEAGRRANEVEFYGRCGSLMQAQLLAEEQAENGPFCVCPICFLDQPWHSSTRLPIKLRRALDENEYYRPGMTVIEASDLVALMRTKTILVDYFAGRQR